MSIFFKCEKKSSIVKNSQFAATIRFFFSKQKPSYNHCINTLFFANNYSKTDHISQSYLQQKKKTNIDHEF